MLIAYETRGSVSILYLYSFCSSCDSCAERPSRIRSLKEANKGFAAACISSVCDRKAHLTLESRSCLRGSSAGSWEMYLQIKLNTVASVGAARSELDRISRIVSYGRFSSFCSCIWSLARCSKCLIISLTLFFVR